MIFLILHIINLLSTAQFIDTKVPESYMVNTKKKIKVNVHLIPNVTILG